MPLANRIALVLALLLVWSKLQDGGIVPGPSPDGPYRVTAIAESGDTKPNMLIASLRIRDEQGWEHDFQRFDPDDMDAKYNTHPAPSLHVEPLGGGNVIYSGPLPSTVAAVDEVIDSL